jgi:DNA-binding NtrC family response regulator
MKDRVWVLDDNNMITKVVGDILTHHGYEVLTFNQPTAAIQRLMNSEKTGERLPQVMIVDYWMPDLKGHEFIKTVREWGYPWNNISFVGMSITDEDQAAMEFAKLGVFILRKPNFNDDDLLLRVMRAQIEREQTQEWILRK